MIIHPQAKWDIHKLTKNNKRQTEGERKEKTTQEAWDNKIIRRKSLWHFYTLCVHVCVYHKSFANPNSYQKCWLIPDQHLTNHHLHCSRTAFWRVIVFTDWCPNSQWCPNCLGFFYLWSCFFTWAYSFVYLRVKTTHKQSIRQFDAKIKSFWFWYLKFQDETWWFLSFRVFRLLSLSYIHNIWLICPSPFFTSLQGTLNHIFYLIHSSRLFWFH